MQNELSATPVRPEGIASVSAPVEQDLERLEAFLRGQVDSFEPEVRPLVRYTLGHSGKKIRPLLVFYAGWREGEAASEELIRAAAVVEMIHLATLVHDDILDDAELRHRMPTVAARYGADVAVLLGDALFAHALRLAAEFPTVAVCRAVSEATRQVCSGEIAQTFARGETALSLPAYYRMIDLKTAELFSVSARLGAFLRGGKPEIVEAISGFARELGVAYQLYDDVADFLGREELAGKTLGTDLASGKFTLPVLLFLERLDERAREEWTGRLVSGTAEPEALLGAMREAEILPQVREAFEGRIASAQGMLDRHPGLEAGASLQRLLDFVATAMDRFIPARE